MNVNVPMREEKTRCLPFEPRTPPDLSQCASQAQPQREPEIPSSTYNSPSSAGLQTPVQVRISLWIGKLSRLLRIRREQCFKFLQLTPNSQGGSASHQHNSFQQQQNQPDSYGIPQGSAVGNIVIGTTLPLGGGNNQPPPPPVGQNSYRQQQTLAQTFNPDPLPNIQPFDSVLPAVQVCF